MFGSRLAAVLVAVVPALVSAATAAAAPGGIGPPDAVTESGDTINQIYWVVFALCAVVFVLVEAALILFIVRFRRRPTVTEDAEGPQIHGNTRLEVIWTIIPAVLLAAMAIFVFVRTPAVLASADGDEALTIRVQAHQFYWQYEYPNGAITLDTLRLPVDRPIRLELQSRDVDHSWWVPELTGKRDAIPGQTNVLEFEPKRTGTFEGECAEHCGVQHAVMYTQVEVLEQGEFDTWLRQAADIDLEELGRNEWEAGCAKCHGQEGEGDIGPPIAGNGTLRNRQALIRLLSRGQNTPGLDGYMPPVGVGWNGRQYDALVAYIKSNATLSGEAESGG
ncbi:MAG: cytochrome c oxidase subunit II [Gaiellaceae bacterium]